MGVLLISIGPAGVGGRPPSGRLRTIADLPVDRWQLFPVGPCWRLREAAERIGFKGLPEPEEIGPRTQYEKISAGMECVAYLGSTCGVSGWRATWPRTTRWSEALDPVSGEPVAGRGARPGWWWTSLGRDNPMLRYDLQGRRPAWSPRPCPVRGGPAGAGSGRGRGGGHRHGGRPATCCRSTCGRHLGRRRRVRARPARERDNRPAVGAGGGRRRGPGRWRTCSPRSCRWPVDVGTGWTEVSCPRAAYKAQRVVAAGQR